MNGPGGAPELELTACELAGDHDRAKPRLLRGDWEAVWHFREITRDPERHPDGLDLIEVLRSKKAVLEHLPEVVTALLRWDDPELDVGRVRRAITFSNSWAVIDELDELLDRALEGVEALEEARGDSARNREEPKPADPTTSGS